MELLEQIEDNVGPPALDFIADRLELVLHAERPDVVASLAQRAHHVILGLPLVNFLLGTPFERIRGHQVRMQQHQNAEMLHTASHCRREGL